MLLLNSTLAQCMIFYTGKSLSEALIFASNKPQYDDRLFIELRSEQFFYTICMFSPCSAKRRASEKELPVKFTYSEKAAKFCKIFTLL